MPPKNKGPKTSAKGDDDGKGKEKKGGSAVKVSFFISYLIEIILCFECIVNDTFYYAD